MRIPYNRGLFYLVLSSAIAGGLLGIGSALVAVATVTETETPRYGAWKPAPDPAQTAENRWIRTGFALFGAYLPVRGDALEFNTAHDSNLDTLDEDCTYFLTSAGPPAPFWTLSVHGRSHRVVHAAGRPASITSAQVPPDGRGRIQVVMGGEDLGSGWLPAGDATPTLTLRLYGLEPDVRDDPRRLPLFAIDKGECR